MQDHIAIPSCFLSSTQKLNDRDHDDHHSHYPTAVSRSGQSAVTSIYRAKIAERCRLITITWCKNLLLHGLSVSIEGPKFVLKPWHFWRKHGSKRVLVGNGGNEEVIVFWDLRTARFHGGAAEPNSDYFVAVVCDEEVVLLLGDMKEEAYRRTSCRSALVVPSLVSRKEDVFGTRKFSARVRFHEKGKIHKISVEYYRNGGNSFDFINGFEPEMEIRLDGQVLIHVKHLQWKFRGNESIHVDKFRVEVFWDVHDWLFSHGLRHALFIFKPVSSSLSSLPLSPAKSKPSLSSSESFESLSDGGSSEFCLFLYAWKVE